MLDPGDVLTIHHLLACYGHHLDRQDWDAFSGLFTPEASIDYLGGTGRTQLQGRPAVVDWFRGVSDQNPPAHHVTNIVIDLSADPAGPVDVHSKFLAPFTREAHLPKRLYGGDYHDTVVSTPEGWRFSHKICQPRWQLAVQIDETAPPHRLTY